MTKWNIREEEYTSVILTDVLEICIIELPKFMRYVQNKMLAEKVDIKTIETVTELTKEELEKLKNRI